jgi:hypothetical protein
MKGITAGSAKSDPASPDPIQTMPDALSRTVERL